MSKQAQYTITPTIARRLAIQKQHLAGAQCPATSAGILDVVRDIGCLQLDPISAVARSHTLVVRSRVGNYDLAELDKLMWEERSLFEYWAHAASIVLSEDYAIHQVTMRNYGSGDSAWSKRVQEWIEHNQPLHDYVLGEITRRGPIASRHLEESGRVPEAWVSTGWTSGRNISRMLDFLWLKGTITVARRSGGQKLWDLTERCLAQWIGNESLSSEEVVYRAAQKSLRALGVGRENHISKHYIRDRYPKLNETLAQLEREGRILRVQIEEDGKSLSGTWYIHADDVPLLERLIAGEWEPRTVLLSPFDNLLCDRARMELLFNFNYRIEIYVPAPKRQYGYYVLPILQGDRFIGRLDATMNRKQKKLFVNAVYVEADAPKTAGKSVRGEIEVMAAWLGAKDIDYTERIPEMWRKALNGSTAR